MSLIAVSEIRKLRGNDLIFLESFSGKRFRKGLSFRVIFAENRSIVDIFQGRDFEECMYISVPLEFTRCHDV